MNGTSTMFWWIKRSLTWTAIALFVVLFGLWIVTFVTTISTTQRAGELVVSLTASRGEVQLSTFHDRPEDEFYKHISLDRWMLATVFAIIGSTICLWKWNGHRRASARGFTVAALEHSSQ